MSCEWNRELLTGWLDGELTSDERAEVEKHLPACKSCRRELEELRDLVGAVKSLPEHPAPASISEGVRKEISGSAGGGKVHSFPRRKWSWIESALSAAAVLFVAVNVVYPGKLNRGGGTSGTSMRGTGKRPRRRTRTTSSGSRVPTRSFSASAGREAKRER